MSRCAPHIAGLVLIVGCATTSRPVFHATDAAFKPTPGPTPRVYVESTLAEVPQSKMRSVGIIEITVSKKKGLEHAIELAAEKGRELGCWVVIEHASFEKLQARASLAFGARVTLAHGPPPAVGHTRAPATLTAKFDCVVQAPNGAGA